MKLLYILKIDFEFIYFKNYHEEREFWTKGESIEDRLRSKRGLTI